MRTEEIGYILLILGVGILLFTFYIAYSLYSQAANGSLFTSNVQIRSSPNVTVTNNSQQGLENAIVSGVVSQLISQLPLQQYVGYTFVVLFLGLFASIGYKLASLGITMMRMPSENGQKDK